MHTDGSHTPLRRSSGASARRWRGLIALALMLIALPLWAAEPDESLPTDPLLVTGTLANGLRYVIRPNAVPPGQVLVRLTVAAGSSTQQEGQQGAAYVTAHALLQATLELDAGRAIADLPHALDEQGYSGGPVSVDFEIASFTVRLPSTDDATLTTGLRFMADIAAGRALTDDRLAITRPRLLAAEQARLDLPMRLKRALIPELVADLGLSDRLPFCHEDTLCELDGDALRTFHTSHYQPGAMALIVVGDVDPDQIVPLIEDELTIPRRGPAPNAIAAPRRLAPPRRSALVVSDRELVALTAELFFASDSAGPTTRLTALEHRLGDRILALALAQRLRQRIDSGLAPYQFAQTWLGSASGPMEIAVANASGDPALWEETIVELCGTVASVAQLGFTPRELADARQEVLTILERRARTADSARSEKLLDEITDAVTSQSSILSDGQRLILAQRLVPGISDQWINAQAALRFDPAGPTLLLLVPESQANIDPEQVRLVASAALDAPPQAGPADSDAAGILASRPEPGRIASVTFDPAGGVTSAWLANGVRLHHRAMDKGGGRVAVAITIAGGKIEETDATRGLTDAATSVFSAPATRSRSAAQLRSTLIGQPVRTSTRVDDDRVVFRLECTHDELETALQLVHVLLTEPRLEPAVLGRWSWIQQRRLEARARSPRAYAMELLFRSLDPIADPRRAPLTPQVISRITIDAAQWWLDRLVTRAPLEIAIVGDVPRDEAFELATTYLASLAPRPRIGPSAFCDLRSAASLRAAVKRRWTIASPSTEAGVVLAIAGAEAEDYDSRRALDLAARILDNRINVACTQRRRLARSVQVRHVPATAYPGSGVLYAIASTDPPLAGATLAEMNRSLNELRTRGPTPAELDLARAQSLATLDQLADDPADWAEHLCELDYRGKTVRQHLGERQAISQVSADAVKTALIAHDHSPAQRLSFIVTPVPARPAPIVPVADKR